MRAGVSRCGDRILTKGTSLIVIGSSLTLSRSAALRSAEPQPGVLTIVNNRLKTAALFFGVAILFGSAVIGCAGTDTVEKTSESQHSETVTAAPAPAVVMVQPAPMVVVPAPVVAAAPVVSQHSSSNLASSETSPSSSSSSEKSSSSKSTTY